MANADEHLSSRDDAVSPAEPTAAVVRFESRISELAETVAAQTGPAVVNDPVGPDCPPPMNEGPSHCRLADLHGTGTGCTD